MNKIYRLAVILAFLIVAIFMSGCYTIVGHPGAIEEGIISEEVVEHKLYYESQYDRPQPYYWGVYAPDPYYSYWYPNSYYYWNSPQRYYYNNSPWYYDALSVPEKKPEVKKRGATELWRSLRYDDQIKSNMKRYEEEDQPLRQLPRRQKSEAKVQRTPVRRRDSSSSSKKRAPKRKDQEEE